MVYLNQVLKEWTVDPYVARRDAVTPGKSLPDLNEIFGIRAEELPDDTILNCFTGRIQNLTHLCIRFAEDVVQKILSTVERIPQTIKQFLLSIIRNTKEGDQSILSLADAFVLTGFFI